MLQIEMFGKDDRRLSSHPQGVWVYSIGRLTIPIPNHRKEKPWLKINSMWVA